MAEPRHIQRRNQVIDYLMQEVPESNTYPMFSADRQNAELQSLLQIVNQLKKFLKFISSLTKLEWLHWMNDACVKPARIERLKQQANPQPSLTDNLTEIVVTKAGETQQQTHKKRRGFRLRAK